VEQSFLQAGVRVEGEIHSEGDLRIDGQVKGSIKVLGMMTIGPRAALSATINCGSVSIHGSVEGRVEAEERIHLARGAQVRADLFCQSLVIDEGVFFHGRSHMGESHSQKQEEPAFRQVLQAPPRVQPTAAAVAEQVRAPLDAPRRGPAAPPVIAARTLESPGRTPEMQRTAESARPLEPATAPRQPYPAHAPGRPGPANHSPTNPGASAMPSGAASASSATTPLVPPGKAAPGPGVRDSGAQRTSSQN